MTEEQKIEKYLIDNDFYKVISNLYVDDMGVHITILNGNWKDDHDRCRNCMEKIGYIQKSVLVTNNGDDMYSMDHLYIKKEQ